MMTSSVLALDRELRRRNMDEPSKPSSPTMSLKQPAHSKRRSGRSEDGGASTKKRKALKHAEDECYHLGEEINPPSLFLAGPQESKVAMRGLSAATDKDTNDNKVAPLSHAALFLAFGPGPQLTSNYNLDVGTECDLRPPVRDYMTLRPGYASASSGVDSAFVNPGLNMNHIAKERDTHTKDMASLTDRSTPEHGKRYSGTMMKSGHSGSGNSLLASCRKMEVLKCKDSVIAEQTVNSVGSSTGMLVPSGQQSRVDGLPSSYGRSVEVSSSGGVLMVPDVDKVISNAQCRLQTTRTTMFDLYQPWVIQTYGDLAKTKTITLRKASRIVRTLLGADRNCAETSKFRFWVRAKGFRIGRPPGYLPRPADEIVGTQTLEPTDREQPLYVPTASVKDSQEWKKVAVVENFFDIIYCVHVEIEGRQGKHAGQKRTYRTITDTYAFLPREAVTKFLLGCLDCQRHPRAVSPSSKASSKHPRAASPTSSTPEDKPSVIRPVPTKATASRSCKAVVVKPCDSTSSSPSRTEDSPEVETTTSKRNQHGGRTLKNKPESSTSKRITSLKNCRIPGKSHKKGGRQHSDTPELDEEERNSPTHMVTITNTDSESIKMTITNAKKSTLLNKEAPTSNKDSPQPKIDAKEETTYEPLENGKDELESPVDSDRESVASPVCKTWSNQRQVHRDSKLLDSGDVDFSLPITTTYLKHMRSLGYTDEDALKIDVKVSSMQHHTL